MSFVLRFCACLFAAIFAASPGLAGPSLLFDPSTGEVISQDRAGEPWYPASLTKLMTAYLVLEDLKSGRLVPDQLLPVSGEAQKQPPSKLGIRAGGAIPLDLALRVMLVYSANDMAVVLAEASGGSIARFVARMNAEAQRLGMSGSHFANPNGLFDERQVITARDIGILARAIRTDFPDHDNYFSLPNVAVGKRKLPNRNSLLRQMPNADGMKTGFVCDSGYNLIGSATADGHRLIAVVLGERSGKARTDLAQMLLTSGFQRPVPGVARQQLTDIANQELGSVVPADMTGLVCRGKNNVAMLRAADLKNWGISLGRYESPEVANKALRGRLLGARELAAGGTPGVLKLPGEAGYAAILAGIDQVPSQSLCQFYHSRSTYCDVMTPDSFARIAAVTTIAEAAKPQITQGSEEPAPIKKSTKKPRRKKARFN